MSGEGSFRGVPLLDYPKESSEWLLGTLSASFLKGGTTHSTTHILVVHRRSRREKIMPKLLYARAPQGTEEERKIRNRACREPSRPGRLDKESSDDLWQLWDGLRTTQIASAELRCHPQTVVRDAGGELEARDEEKEAHWTLDAITTAARERGITLAR